MTRIQRLVGGLWLGSAFFLMLATSAAFAARLTPSDAADVVGAMLTRWHYIALAAPLLLFVLELRRVRYGVLIVLFIAIIAASFQGFADVRIRQIRFASDIPISSLDRENPLRRQFGMLHAVSVGLLVLQAILAAIVVMAREKDVRTELPSSSPPAPASTPSLPPE